MKEKVASRPGQDSMKEEGIHPSSIAWSLLSFPDQLMALLDCGQVSDSMWWLPQGDAFCIAPSGFAAKVLDQHFNSTKFESFTRKLNRWYVQFLSSD